MIGTFRLPRQDWWDDFKQVSVQCRRHRGDDTLRGIIDAMAQAVDLYRRTGHSYGYAFYILMRP